MAIVEFGRVSKTYGQGSTRVHALRDVSLTVADGDFALLLGPSGAGKSTLLKLLLLQERPEAGVIRIAGRDVHRLARTSIPYVRRNVGMVFQDFRLLPEASALENVALALHVLGWPRKKAQACATEALRRVGFDSARPHPVHCLSGGEQQRIAIARATAAAPALLLADEPTGNLDPAAAREVWQVFDQLHQQGTSLIVATHAPEPAVSGSVTSVFRMEHGTLRSATLEFSASDTVAVAS